MRIGFWQGMMLCGALTSVAGGDWPQWRYDAARSASSPHALPDELHLQWIRAYSPRQPVWDDPLNHDLMPYDRVFEPIVLGSSLLAPFNDTDQLVALDTRTGQERWRFTADGPLRLPPAGSGDRVYVASDDGRLYCLRVEDGSVAWSVRGGPSARKALGNGRVISAWPARGGPVVRDGVVYFAASIWPFMGTFIYALDAREGTVRWVNDGTGASFIKQPHSAPAFAGVAPQGALAATKQMLLVPGGRSVPAAFDRATGKLLYFRINEGGKGNGGSFVIANEREFFVHTRRRGVRAFDLRSGKQGEFTCNEPVLAGDCLYTALPHGELGRALSKVKEQLLAANYGVTLRSAELRDAREAGDEAKTLKLAAELLKAHAIRAAVAWEWAKLEQARARSDATATAPVIQCLGPDKKIRWEIAADGSGDLIQAGNRLYAAGAEAITVIQLPKGNEAPRRIASLPVEGTVRRLLAGDDRLFAVTLDGRILAFGPETRPAVRLEPVASGLPERPAARERARRLLERVPGSVGYALCYGGEDVSLLEALVAEAPLRVVIVEPDAERVAALRAKFMAAGEYGRRVTVHRGDVWSYGAPPYFARLVLVSPAMAARLRDRRAWEAVYASVRPYGGVLWVDAAPDARPDLARTLRTAGLAQGRWVASDAGFGLVREGRLPGSGDWTHLYGNIANTVKSDDQTVKLPLGVLWFGGNSNLDVLPRHAHGPGEQVVGGRLFIEGLTSLSARDVYTGQRLWKTEIPDLDTFGVYYDETYTNAPLSTIYNQRHIPGANARGANFVATEDEVYLAVGNECRVLSARTGKVLRRIRMPGGAKGEKAPAWGFIGVYKDLLLGGRDFARYNQRYHLTRRAARLSLVDLSASAGLVVFNRHTGERLWQAPANYGFLHNGIVAGHGRIYCLDRLPESIENKLKRRGRPLPARYRVVAFDAESGAVLWQHTNRVFGTWLAYSAPHDVLLQAGASAPDRLADEAGQGMGVHRGDDGRLLWFQPKLKYTGPCILYHDLIITTPSSYQLSSGAYELLTGKPHWIEDPLTGDQRPWRIYRTYGCNTPIASEHLMTFRSGAAGFYDLDGKSGTGNFGGFKSGCSANLIAANGVLNAPDYTRTCTCPYQNQTSLALVPLPESEIWTYNVFDAPAERGERVKRLGLNLGAPGDRLADSGTLWLEYPALAGQSANLTVTLSGATNWFRRHASRVSGQRPTWVTASGVEGVEKLTLRTVLSKPAKDGHTPKPPLPYTVRLYFVEPRELGPGDRVFTVALQGQDVLVDWDVAAVTGGPWRGVMREFTGVPVGETLSLAFRRTAGSKFPPVLCGVELVAEESAAPTVELSGQNRPAPKRAPEVKKAASAPSTPPPARKSAP